MFQANPCTFCTCFHHGPLLAWIVTVYMPWFPMILLSSTSLHSPLAITPPNNFVGDIHYGLRGKFPFKQNLANPSLLLFFHLIINGQTCNMALLQQALCFHFHLRALQRTDSAWRQVRKSGPVPVKLGWFIIQPFTTRVYILSGAPGSLSIS